MGRGYKGYASVLKNFGGVVYSATHQRRFNELLDKEDFDGAIGVLEGLPDTADRNDKIKRASVIARGYRILCQSLMEHHQERLSSLVATEADLREADEEIKRLKRTNVDTTPIERL